MNTLLIGINAKYIHSNLAIRSLKQYAAKRRIHSVELAEFTINQHRSFILSEIYKHKPELIGFSCYIWNYEMIVLLAAELKKILPETLIFFGGPEVSFNPAEILQKTAADLIICGEGEESFYRLVSALEQGNSLASVPGIAYRKVDGYAVTPPAPLLSMDDLPFVYQNMDDLAHKIIYFESSRGCPFQCQYCLSGQDRTVRFMSLDKVFSALDFFLSKRVRQVKFVDRTFNCDRVYALAVWQYLKEHDNGYTNFHFEIAAELLDNDTLSFLKTVRKGFFQFEIGVQSTNPDTLQAICRITKIDLLRHIVGSLKEGGNIHLHLDLIVGLPYEDYHSFRQSFNHVYELSPDQFQIGFLKLLKGSGLAHNTKNYGIVCSETPPYEVLFTDALPYSDLLRLKRIEDMVETYYNSNRFHKTVSYLLTFFDDPFSFFEALAEFYETSEYHLVSHTNLDYYTILYRFFHSICEKNDTIFQWNAKFDLYSHEKAKRMPEWLTVSLIPEYKTKIYQFYEQPQQIQALLPEYQEYEPKQIGRMAHIEVFPFHPITGALQKTAVLFNYKSCDLLGNAAYTIINLEDDTIERTAKK